MPWGAAVAAGIGAGGSIFSGILGSNSANKAASQQFQSAEMAAMLQAQQQQATLQRTGAYQNTGLMAANDLSYLTGSSGAGAAPTDWLQADLGQGFLAQQYPQFNAPAPFSYQAYQAPAPFSYGAFQAPQPFSYSPFSFGQQDFQQSPGYQWQLGQGISAAQNAASATGSPLGGNALREIAKYGTGLANQDWYNALGQARQNYSTNYNTALGAYDTNYNTSLGAYGANYQTAKGAYDTNAANALQAYNTNFGDAFQTYNQNFNNQFATYQLGYQQNQALKGQLLNYLTGAQQLGANTALGVGTQGVQSFANIGNNLVQAGNAQAAGTVGSANALNNAVTGVANNLGGYMLTPQGQQAFQGIGQGISSLFTPNTPGYEISPAVGNVLSNIQQNPDYYNYGGTQQSYAPDGSPVF